MVQRIFLSAFPLLALLAFTPLPAIGAEAVAPATAPQATNAVTPPVGIASPLGSTPPSFAREPDSAADSNKQARLACPSALRALVATSDGNTNGDIKGWLVGGSEQSSPLKGARLFAGPVAEQTMERFNELTAIPFMNRDKGEFEQVWTLDEALVRTGVMLVCDYSGSSHFLMRALPAGTKTCKEVDPIDKSEDSVITVSCQ